MIECKRMQWNNRLINYILFLKIKYEFTTGRYEIGDRNIFIYQRFEIFTNNISKYEIFKIQIPISRVKRRKFAINKVFRDKIKYSNKQLSLDLSMLENIHCHQITDVSMLGKVCCLNLSHLYKLTDVAHMFAKFIK